MFGWILGLFETVTNAPAPVRLNLERCENRETPATYVVTLRSIITGEVGQTAAAISGSLEVNAAYPSISGGGILVDATSPEEAIRKGLFGRIGVRFNGNNSFYDYGMTTTGLTIGAQKPFLVGTTPPDQLNPPGRYTVKLEDQADATPCDWDYDDRKWYVDADDSTSPPPPPGTVSNSPPWVDGPKVEIWDKDNMGMTDGKVAKWRDAYEQVNGKVRVKPNFVADDADRFRIRVTDMRYAAGPGTLSGDPRPVRIVTDSDLGNTLLLYPVSNGSGYLSGVYETKQCVLVSNDVDDTYPVNGRADNAINDQTFKVKLGDTLTISYDTAPGGHGFGTQIIHKRVPVRVLKEAKVSITVLTTRPEKTGTNDPANAGTNSPIDAVEGVTAAMVDEWMNFAQQQYAQVGVRLKWTVRFADQPRKVVEDEDMHGDVNLADGLTIPVIEPEEMESLALGKRTDWVGGVAIRGPIRTSSEGDVDLFVINYFSEPTVRNGQTVYDEYKDALGYSFIATRSGVVDDTADVSVVSAKNRAPFVVAHEIGHVLTNYGHTEVSTSWTLPQVQSNLMREWAKEADQLAPPVDTTSQAYIDWKTAPKRLDQSQQNSIWDQRTAIVKDFIP